MRWFAAACAVLGIGLLVYEWLYRRKHPKLPPEGVTATGRKV